MIAYRKMVLSCVALLAVATCVSTADAQFRGFGGRPEDLLRRPDVQKELELVPYQIKDLSSGGGDRGQQIRDLFSGLGDLPREEREAKLREAIAKAGEDSEKRIADVLLDGQLKRLKQLVVQYSLRGGTSRALASTTIKKELGITDEQEKEIAKKAEEVKKKWPKILQSFAKMLRKKSSNRR